MKIDTAIILYAMESNQSQSGSSIVNLPDKLVTPKLRDVVRKRLVKTNPDVDAGITESDNAAFVGKKYRVQDTHYGHLISEHDNEASAEKAANARPFSRVLHHPEPQFEQRIRNVVRRKVKNGK